MKNRYTIKKALRLFFILISILFISNKSSGQTTVDLTSHVTSTAPAGATLEFHTALPATAANLVNSPATVGTGVYYAVYHNTANSCYTGGSPIVVALNTCPSTTADLTSHQPSGSLPANSTLEWHTALPATVANLIPTPTAVGAGNYYLVYHDTSINCYSATDGVVVVAIAPCCPTLTNVVANNVNPTSCGGSNGSIKICGLVANSTNNTVNFQKGTVAQTAQTLTADASGCIVITGLSAGNYDNIIITNAACTAGTSPLNSITLSDPSAPVSPTGLTGSPNPSCTGVASTLTATIVSGATVTWSASPAGSTLGAGSVSGTTASNTLTSATAGTYTISLTQTVGGCTSPVASVAIVINTCDPCAGIPVPSLK